ncbi:VTT domain-containing protein [Microbacteriaceae bacterium VKM Ac-2854]|nr:VTT domain-containing protein [Microbacteriaceae bacterium VKM Ac-2854]
MPAFFDGLGFWELLLGLFVVVFLRAQATYWIARGVVSGVRTRRWGRWLDAPAMERGARILNRWGAPAVTVSFLTVGLQTVMNAAAGAARMRWLVYLLAMVPGCIAWAFIYATIGFTVLWAVIGAAAGSPWGVALLLVLLLLLAALLLTRRRRSLRGSVAVRGGSSRARASARPGARRG